MEKVLGLGGVFFRAKDPKALSDWYVAHLGIDMPQGAWRQAEGWTVFAPFSEDTTYFGRDSQQFMLNFRVGDLEAMTQQLISAGIRVETNADWDAPEIGRFARIHDPEGNPIELWEPAQGALED